MIEVSGLSKDYGSTHAVKDLSFSVKPGIVTGFLGPNGAGKSTTMRMIVGLDRPTRGTATINGRPYRELREPLKQVGCLLDAKAVHPNRSARNHLKWVAQTNGIPTSRVDEVLELVGLSHVAKKKAGGFSLGMGQRLGLATALLGDPKILVLDEPVNGLDPEGIKWVRDLVKALAAQGKTVLISSHLLSEMALTADHLVVIGKGQLIADCPMDEFVARAHNNATIVRTPDDTKLTEALAANHIEYSVLPRGDAPGDGSVSISIPNEPAPRIGEIAFTAGVRVHELFTHHASLEEAFIEMTGDSVEYSATFETPDGTDGAETSAQAARGKHAAPAAHAAKEA